MKNNILILLGILSIASVICVVNSTQPEVLPLGSNLPYINYKNGDNNIIKRQSGAIIIIMVFSFNCPHCLYELDVLENNIDNFSNHALYLISIDNELEIKFPYNKWPQLLSGKRNNVHWGFIDTEQYRSIFGSVMTPSIFIYNRKDILIKKIFGEIKFERLLMEIN